MTKPLFQKRHYEAVARVLRLNEPSHHLGDRSTVGELDRWAIIVDAFTDMFAADNACFKRDRFLLATSESTRRSEPWERSYAREAAE